VGCQRDTGDLATNSARNEPVILKIKVSSRKTKGSSHNQILISLQIQVSSWILSEMKWGQSMKALDLNT